MIVRTSLNLSTLLECFAGRFTSPSAIYCIHRHVVSPGCVGDLCRLGGDSHSPRQYLIYLGIISTARLCCTFASTTSTTKDRLINAFHLDQVSHDFN